MSVPAFAVPPDIARHVDQRVILHGLRWADYEALLAMRGDSPGTRITYLKGVLELMSPSIDHEQIKTRLGRLLIAYAEAQGIGLEGYGSWTVRSESGERGVEADECYVVGVPQTRPTRPDIAVEVIWTSGGLDKLEVYCGLGVPEVWVWRDGALRFHLLREDVYVTAPCSELFPELDPALIARCMEAPSQTRAVAMLRESLAVG
jgi:Uma2 family endonuclease